MLYYDEDRKRDRPWIWILILAVVVILFLPDDNHLEAGNTVLYHCTVIQSGDFMCVKPPGTQDPRDLDLGQGFTVGARGCRARFFLERLED